MRNKIRSTKDLRVNSVLRVYKKGFGYSKIHIIDNSDYYLAAGAEKEFIDVLRDGDVLDAYYWTEHESSYEFPLRVLGHFRIDLKIAFFEHTDKISWKKERRCLTAHVREPFSFFTFHIGDTPRTFESRDVTLRQGTLVELNDREALLHYEESMDEGDFLKGHISVGDGDIDILARIHTATTSGDYRLEFIGLGDKDRCRLLDHVLSLYRE